MKKAIAHTVITLLIFSAVMAQENKISSSLEVFTIATGERKTVLQEADHFEAPNWSTNGDYFIINQKGRLFKVSLDGTTKTVIDTGSLTNCNNDHGISFDGKLLAISTNDPIETTSSGSSRIYTLPIAGGEPQLVTPQSPSYWHGWAPDGRSVVYTAMRNGDYDIYSIPINGGKETRLTHAEGLDDGPEYSPDAKYIYFNSMQSGKMEIWRMHADGSTKEQLTNDALSNWFAHPSPDGKYFVFLSYLKDQGDQQPPMKSVALRLYNLEDNSIQKLCEFIGGQGSINVPSWSPNGKQFAFVSYTQIK